MKECTCFKSHIYGRCEVCKEFYNSLIAKEVKILIEKYPLEVKEMIDVTTRKDWGK